MDSPTPADPSRQPEDPASDPHHSAFWMFISFLGISMPKPANQRKAMYMMIIGAFLFLAFLATGMFILFRLW